MHHLTIRPAWPRRVGKGRAGFECPLTVLDRSLLSYTDFMPTTGNPRIDIALYALAGVIVLFLGYQIGRMIGSLRASRLLAQKKQDLFTAQKGFKTLYETELNNVKTENAKLTEQG